MKLLFFMEPGLKKRHYALLNLTQNPKCEPAKGSNGFCSLKSTKKRQTRHNCLINPTYFILLFRAEVSHAQRPYVLVSFE